MTLCLDQFSFLRRAMRKLGWRSKASRLASIGLLVVLVALPGFALWGAMTTYQTGLEVRRSTELNDLYENARYAVGAEESLERKYRLEPGHDVRARHSAAGADMVEALQRAALMESDQAERRLIKGVLVKHQEYLEAIGRMFAAVDLHDTEASNAIDNAEVDPSFDAIESEVVALSDRHRANAAEHLNTLTAIQYQIVVASPVVFAFGAVLVLFFWKMLRIAHRRAQEGLAREASSAQISERRFRGMALNTPDLILLCAAPGIVTYQSPAAETTWGYSSAELLGEPIVTLVHPDDQAALRDLWEQVREIAPEDGKDATRTTELQLRNEAGIWRQVDLIATNSLHDPAIQSIVVTVRDITERKVFEQQLTQQAFYDPLTGLPNRVLFRDRLEQALVRAGRRKDAVGLLFLDLDKFKLVNDSLGHQTGDKLLTEAAARLRACVRAQDTVARLSGDEFVVVLELLAGEEDALTVAKAISHQFTCPFILEGREIVVTASIGIAVSDAGREHAESLVRDADVAMYRAKSSGRGRHVMFDPSMHTDSLARLELENDLRHALDRHELRVFYQPIVSIESGDFSEVEALVRWQHPTRGLVSPGEFIPMAEDTGMIIPLGMWVLEEACRQVAAWHAQFPTKPPLTLSVNLSPRQFQQSSLVADVAAALGNSGLPASSLKLEITESVIMQDAEGTIRTLWELKDLGLQIAVDDFGTGYSSLSYLKRLPLDVLKIDRSFVSGIGRSQEDTAIIQAIMAMAKSLSLKVTGEGIETAEQATMLGEWGCDRGQGYLFSKPLDSQTAGALLEASAQQSSGEGFPSGEACNAMRSSVTPAAV